MSDNYIAHFGIKGMKWGVRRFQNKDGSLTELGQKRVQRDLDELSEENRKKYKPNVNKWVKSDLKETRDIIKNTNSLANTALQSSKKKSAKNKSIKMDLSKMSDKEMRDRINRELLERQYSDMFSPKNVNKGRERMERFLEGTTTALAVTGTALSIALSIRQLGG